MQGEGVGEEGRPERGRQGAERRCRYFVIYAVLKPQFFCYQNVCLLILVGSPVSFWSSTVGRRLEKLNPHALPNLCGRLHFLAEFITKFIYWSDGY